MDLHKGIWRVTDRWEVVVFTAAWATDAYIIYNSKRQLHDKVIDKSLEEVSQ